MSKRTGKTLLFFPFALCLFLSFISFALAQDLEVEYPEIGGIKPETVQSGLPEYVKYVFNFAIAIAGLIALGALILGGFLYFTSTGKPEKLKNAKDQIFAAVLGLTILFSSYLILTTINPQLLIFDFPPLGPIISPDTKPLPPVKTEGLSLIVEELPLGQAAKKGLWEKERTEELEYFIIEFENFLNQETKLDDPELKNDVFKRISDLNKYLKTLTDMCRCGNLRSFCSKPETGGLAIGCSGDPCQTDQDINIESDSPRARMNKVLAIDREKIKTLLDYQKKITEQKDLLREEIRKFQEVEGGVIACQNQNYELATLYQYLDAKQVFEEQGNQINKIGSYLEPKGDPLTFYCSVGGTIFDYPYIPEKLEISPEEISPTEIPTEIEKISCPVELPLGKTLDELRELAIIGTFKLEKTSLLITQMVAEIQKMTELVSECNEQDCDDSCACIPNPCFECCSPIPCTICVPFCLSHCIQSIGGCYGDACPWEKIEKQSEQIKQTEEKILKTIKEIKNIFPQTTPLLKTVDNISTSVGLCYSSDIYNPAWILLNCEQAQGNYGPSGQLMTNCHPRNLFCCTISEDAKPLLPPSTDKPPVYIIPAKEFQPLPSINNCPQGWLCNYNVKYYNQYNKDASEPLKQLLSCMRKRLDRIQGQEGLETTIGRISSISDQKLYQGTCDWEAGPTEPGGCSHLYEVKHGKARVSAHYGGSVCRHEHKSYAIDIDISDDFQKKYADEIVEAAKECFPGSYILDKTTHIHIDIGEVYHCKSNDS